MFNSQRKKTYFIRFLSVCSIIIKIQRLVKFIKKNNDKHAKDKKCCIGRVHCHSTGECRGASKAQKIVFLSFCQAKIPLICIFSAYRKKKKNDNDIFYIRKLTKR